MLAHERVDLAQRQVGANACALGNDGGLERGMAS
jgi:hypothetical protein